MTFERPLNRIKPDLSPEQFRTYTVSTLRQCKSCQRRYLADTVVCPHCRSTEYEDLHFEEVPCEDIPCKGYRIGWVVTIDENPPAPPAPDASNASWKTHKRRVERHMELLRLAEAIRSGRTRRRYIEVKEGTLTNFEFEPGQPCFSKTHKKRVWEREEIFIARNGDWRKAIGQPLIHTGPEQFMEDALENQDRLTTILDRG